jgi:hypothetical protein
VSCFMLLAGLRLDKKLGTRLLARLDR